MKQQLTESHIVWAEREKRVVAVRMNAVTMKRKLGFVCAR